MLDGDAVRGETVDEITGAASTMRAKMTKVAARRTPSTWSARRRCSGSYNVPPGAALIVRAAACRSPARQPGAVVEIRRRRRAGALGVKIELRPDEITRCIYEAGIGFMFAPAHHPATKNVASTRVELGTRTIFNLLGPISNPAGVKRQVIGGSRAMMSDRKVSKLARFGNRLGGHGSTVSTRSHIRPDPYRGAGEWHVRTFDINPEDIAGGG